MTWVRLDDAFPTNPKVFGLSDQAFRAHVVGLCYASQHLTDGFVPVGYVKPTPARELVAAGLWDQEPNGWRIHDFLDYNPSKQEVEQERSRKQAAGRAGGLASGKARASRLLPEVPNPDPTRPVPDPKNGEAKAALSAVPDNRPDHDQAYLAQKLAEDWGQELGYAGLQKLNNAYGRVTVTDALRSLRGFPPEEAVRSVYAYVESICKSEVTPLAAT